MKTKFAAGLVFALVTAGITFGADGSWTGYISDSECGAKGSNEKHAACATKCVKEKGAKYLAPFSFTHFVAQAACFSFEPFAPHSLSEMYPVQLPSAPKVMPAVTSANTKPAANFVFMVIPLLRFSEIYSAR